MAAVASQSYQQQQQQQYYGARQYPQHQQQHMYSTQSVMEDVSDEEHDMDEHELEGADEDDDDESMQGDMIDSAHAHFYHQQQQQAQYYQQHQQQHSGSQSDLTNPASASGPSRPLSQQQQQQQQQQQHQQQQQQVEGEDDAYSDEESDTDSMPDENIDFSLTYALHTFLATVEGQASVVKGDSLVLLDDANSYWWLVRVLKTEDVGYIPAENIETPYERLARLNKHRNVDLAAATLLEKNAATVHGREKLKDVIAGKAKGLRRDFSGEVNEENIGGGRRVVFAPPTYVDHPGVTWSSDEDDSSADEGEMDIDQVERDSTSTNEQDVQTGDVRHETEIHKVEQSVGHPGPGSEMDMEPDDGIEWADNAAEEGQRRVVDQKQRQSQQQQHHHQQAPSSNTGATIQPKSNNPFAPRETTTANIAPSASNTSLASSSAGSAIMDPAQAGNETRRLTVTPAVASGPLLPSAMQAQNQAQQAGSRNVSGQSVQSVSSVVSTVSSQRSSTPTSPEEQSKKGKKMKKGSKEDLDNGDKKKRGVLGGLFHRKGKDKSGKGTTDTRSSEESMVGGPVEQRWSEEKSAPSPALSQQSQNSLNQNQQQQQQIGVSSHGLRLQQQDQARMQSYTSKYLNKSPSSELHSPTAAEAAAAVAQSAAAMHLAASMNSGGSIGNNARPSSIILSPNPAGPPLLNVIRIFAGDHIKSESSFKTALINETTSASDLIKQAMQRFHLSISSSTSSTSMDNGYFITIRDVNGEEMELHSDEKPLVAFQEAVQKWASESDEDLTARLGAITPTVKRSSVSSISSVVSLSNHPAIKKLGMNDFSDDSTVKIYINRRRPGSVLSSPNPNMNVNGNGTSNTNGMPEPASEFSSYSTQLSTVQEQESSPEHHSGEWTKPLINEDGDGRGGDITPPASAQHRFNNSLTINTNGQSSPERYSSPSARFTIQLIIYPNDVPDNIVFDPSSDSIIPRSLLKERQSQGQGQNTDSNPRKRLFILPRNANVVEVIEQGLDRFGIQEGVVDGGDDVEDKVGKRRSITRVRYSLAAIVNGQERLLSASSRILEAYDHPPNLRPMEHTTPEQRRRSRDLQYNAGAPSELLPTDPVFILRRVVQNPQQRGISNIGKIDPMSNTKYNDVDGDSRSPAEIIAAQRAASRANQKALLSAHTNQTQGVDIILPDQKGTFRSSVLIEGDDEIVRYSYIDNDGETYDISELLEEEWGSDVPMNSNQMKGNNSMNGNQEMEMLKPNLNRMTTDQSAYITAPSTPDEGLEKDHELHNQLKNAIFRQAQKEKEKEKESKDILKGVVQTTVGQGSTQEIKLEEKLIRVIDKVKYGLKGSTSSEEVLIAQQKQLQQHERNVDPVHPERQSINSGGNGSGRSTPQAITIPNFSNDNQSSYFASDVNATPKATQTFDYSSSTPRSNSRSSQHHQSATTTTATAASTAQSINKIISSRHRQQPSIASIMSDLESHNQSQSRSRSRNGVDTDQDDENEDTTEEEDRSSTPVTATSSTHPTPPFSGAVFTRAISNLSPTPRSGPVRYKDDFGIKEMMAIITLRSKEYLPTTSTPSPTTRRRRKSSKKNTSTSVERGDNHRERDDGDDDEETDTDEIDEQVNSVDHLLSGQQINWNGIHPDIKNCFQDQYRKLQKLEDDIDDLLSQVAAL
ncbi:uncharacterized protein IL334_006512 [Kwoniella shivajii]|uniref:SH3 domain-containing protein n=1 Tax=Kwoniella shivajii TaxID=564305 RepID=A0ABZ1D6H8_9TREE|nr:hypothetical protein IL334_006512 [Kwoniella shivajii]